MTQLLSGFGVMRNKDDEHISPYLRRRLRSHVEAQRERINSKTQPVRGKPTNRSVTRDRAGEASLDEQNDR
jgi:hypothetical protein